MTDEIELMTTQERIAKYGPEEAMTRTYGQRTSMHDFLPKTRSEWNKDEERFITLHVFPSRSFRFPKSERKLTKKERLTQKRVSKGLRDQ